MLLALLLAFAGEHLGLWESLLFWKMVAHFLESDEPQSILKIDILALDALWIISSRKLRMDSFQFFKVIYFNPT